jgi:hypothetical protein
MTLGFVLSRMLQTFTGSGPSIRRSRLGAAATGLLARRVRPIYSRNRIRVSVPSRKVRDHE